MNIKYIPSIFLCFLISACGGGDDDNDKQKNQKPIANAGENKNVTIGNLVTLNGNNSTDPDNDPLTYSWVFTSTPTNSSVSLNKPHSINPTFTPDIEGDYLLSLVVNDGEYNSDADSISISTTSISQKPIAFTTLKNTNIFSGIMIGQTSENEYSKKSAIKTNINTEKNIGTVIINPDGSIAEPKNIFSYMDNEGNEIDGIDCYNNLKINNFIKIDNNHIMYDAYHNNYTGDCNSVYYDNDTYITRISDGKTWDMEIENYHFETYNVIPSKTIYNSTKNPLLIDGNNLIEITLPTESNNDTITKSTLASDMYMRNKSVTYNGKHIALELENKLIYFNKNTLDIPAHMLNYTYSSQPIILKDNIMSIFNYDWWSSTLTKTSITETNITQKNLILKNWDDYSYYENFNDIYKSINRDDGILLINNYCGAYLISNSFEVTKISTQLGDWFDNIKINGNDNTIYCANANLATKIDLISVTSEEIKFNGDTPLTNSSFSSLNITNDGIITYKKMGSNLLETVHVSYNLNTGGITEDKVITDDGREIVEIKPIN